MVSCFGHVSQVFFNASIIKRPSATHQELRACLGTAAERAGIVHIPAVLVRQDWLPSEWESVIQDFGFVAMVRMTA